MTDFRSGFIAILGKPNVGKSTLVNTLLGQKIAAVSPRPQTTRRRQLGILTTESAQLVFVDTPGVHTPRHKLGQFFNQEAEESLDGVDLILFLVDASADPDEDDRRVADLLSGIRRRPEILLGLNKLDLVPEETLEARRAAYQALVPGAQALAFSAARRDGLPELLAALTGRLPVRPAEFPEEQVTDLYEREIAAELVREAALVFLQQEVPHALAVRLDEFSERANGSAYIAATLLVERESQKGIVIGENAAMLKKIGSAARMEIEAMSGRKVFLELRAKVAKDWRNDEAALRRLGYGIKEEKMIPGSLVFFLVAALDWAAVARGWKRVEALAKPGAMVILLGLLGLVGGFGAVPLVCFFLGICLSLVGDVCLLLSSMRFSDRWFLPGLAAFLLAHLAYIAGLNIPLPQVSPFWLLVLAAILALSARRVLKSILAGVRQKGLRHMLAPVAVYGTVITLMLFSAMLTLSRLDWAAGPAALVGLGAMLFYASDVLLAWNKFVSPIQRGRLYNMILYHLGQFGLVAGIILQFGK